MDVDELQHALGGIVLTAATLIEDCEQIARHDTGRDIPTGPGR
jgi:hypothetical protein